WISLRELLTRCGRRLTVNELWALCFSCLSSLQTYIDFPGSRDEFYLAPEYQEHGIVTEKVCVYGVAAILWAAAKFSLSPHQKLAMPPKLKRLLLEMAKRTPIERPSIAMAKRSCHDYLSYQGINAETVWNNLIRRVPPTASKSIAAEDLSVSETQQSSLEESSQNSGFVPMAIESRLAPVPGPVPHSYPVDKELQLPEAFTSPATHFSPIILTDEGFSEAERQHLGASIGGPLEQSILRAYNGQTNPESEKQSPLNSAPPKVHPALQEVIDLLKGEFSIDGDLDNGQEEDVTMGEYIFSLKDLQYQMFAGVVKERFKDLYWEEDLLGVLHCLVNYSPSTLGSNEQPPSKAVKRANLTPPLISAAWGGKRELCLHGCLDLNGNVHTASPSDVDPWEGPEASGISLRELLTRCGRRLTVNELWALCFSCLSSLQTYIDFPAYLCLDTMHVGLFFAGSRDEFYLAPEYQEHGIVTEKVCVYGVAAILWAAAKFSLSPHQKLAMPPKLKRLLLEMAKRTPIERPSIAMAKRSCHDYLSYQGINAETVWNNLIRRVPPTASKSIAAEDLSVSETQQSSLEESSQNSGFVPMAIESRLAPVPGPVPHSYPVDKELQLPEAFTSPATHFSPIILTDEGFSEAERQHLGASIGGPLEQSILRAYNGQTNPESEKQSPLNSAPPKVHPALQEVIDLLKGEFSIDGDLDNGQEEDVTMGEYIFSLKDLQYQMFAGVVKERFKDLYWEEDLLGVLHCLVNYSPSTLGSNEQPPSKAVKRANLTPPLISAAWGGKRELCLHGCLDLNGNVHTASPSDVDPWEGPEARPAHGEYEAACKGLKSGSEELQHSISPSVSTDSLNTGLMEGGDHLAGGSDESPSEAEFPSGREEGLTQEEQMSPDWLQNMEDSDSLASERLLSPRSRAEGPGPRCSPAWALALYGPESFSAEVMEYAVNLGQHTGSPCLDVKTQELQQQLMIETRNLKKTRNFYQKLLQQERKNKGSDNKLMLSKLKSQLAELRSKVVFLDTVKKYLEILSVDQWGLEVSLLPSLASSGPGSLDFHSSEDPSALSFGNSKGKSILQVGSHLGLMAYLYARNAALEGYIQQFLYTYRFLCTPEQLLQFIMDKFIAAARQGPDMSGEAEKIFHRSLDLLQFWITDCRQVDFTPKSSLLDTFESFLNNEVIPVDSRGEFLLAALHTPAYTTWSHRSESLLSLQEDDDSVCVHLSTEDLGRKWTFSRMVEPSAAMSKDKAFSVATALPMPCYGSLADDLSTVCLQSKERIPFSQNECSAQHVAQQLTLLQQEMFQGCHPVHFLNSRIQGVRDKVSAPNKNVSQHGPPAEGGGPPVCEEPPSDSFLQQLLSYADSVANWISAEIVICDSAKTQVALLTKFLWIGKHCYESRNFATTMQVLGGLENVTVRQLPAWKHLSSKVCEILEELRAVFLKSDDLCLMGGEHARRRPTLPSAHILAMHVQQQEIGAFTLTTGAYKWTKLRSIAKVVSQVHAFQEAVYPYSPDLDLHAYLRSRMARLSTSDLHLLAADNDADFRQSSERQARRIQNTLRRVKATFQ
ncbi:hypothetical protein JOQ06_020279, partial [Pogonophryne albipinna]